MCHGMSLSSWEALSPGTIWGALLKADSWRSTDQPECAGAGMPEEMAISKAALARSFDVLALTPKEKTYRCWDTEWPNQSEDVPRVRALRCYPVIPDN